MRKTLEKWCFTNHRKTPEIVRWTPLFIGYSDVLQYFPQHMKNWKNSVENTLWCQTSLSDANDSFITRLNIDVMNKSGSFYEHLTRLYGHPTSFYSSWRPFPTYSRITRSLTKMLTSAQKNNLSVIFCSNPIKELTRPQPHSPALHSI